MVNIKAESEELVYVLQNHFLVEYEHEERYRVNLKMPLNYMKELKMQRNNIDAIFRRVLEIYFYCTLT